MQMQCNYLKLEILPLIIIKGCKANDRHTKNVLQINVSFRYLSDKNMIQNNHKLYFHKYPANKISECYFKMESMSVIRLRAASGMTKLISSN